ncbi:MAG TPA: 16S rRNA (uracil(1498)-N(3))-methyltransferase, partial [Alcanivorax sp.]|nr:16S rRNA (uracil(1498)-N(3))-methyltransferase [Alcanivorax sp.]
MNLLLLHPDQRLDGDRWRLDDRQATHVRSVLKLAEGDHCRAGLLDEGTGQAVIES